MALLLKPVSPTRPVATSSATLRPRLYLQGSPVIMGMHTGQATQPAGVPSTCQEAARPGCR